MGGSAYMSGNDYLEALGAELSKTVPLRERMDILRYYKGRFEDAGPEGEQALIEALGDPWELARKIIQEDGYENVGDAPEAPSAPQAPADGGRRERRRVRSYVALGVAAVVAIAVISTVPRLVFGAVRRAVSGTGVREATVVEMEDRPAVDYIAGEAVQAEPGSMAGEFTDITVDIPMGDVTIRAGNTFGVSLSGFNGPYRPNYTIEDGRLSMQDWEGSDGDIESLIESIASLKSLQGGVTITVPEGILLGQVEVRTALGDVTLADTAVDYANLKTDMGDISCGGLGGTTELVAETSMGNIDLEGWLPLMAELETDMGDIHVAADCARERCQYELETSMGEVEIDGRKYADYAESVGGDTVYDLDAETSMGDIKVNFGEVYYEEEYHGEVRYGEVHYG